MGGASANLPDAATLHTLVDQAPVSIAMFDTSMCYLAASRGWISDHNLQRTDLRGQCHYEIFPELPVHWREVHRRGMQGEIVRAEAEPFRRTDGTVQWVRWKIGPWRDRDGAIGGIIIHAEDVTDDMETIHALKQARDDLHEVTPRAGAGRERERVRVAHHLHEMIAQDLAALKRDLARMPVDTSADRDALSAMVVVMCERVNAALDATRRLATDLRPSVLDHLGVAPAIESLVADFTRSAGIDCRFVVEPAELPFTETQAAGMYWCAAEALNNVKHHARASVVLVRLGLEEDNLTLRVKDNGCGFASEVARRAEITGLAAMRERAFMLDGHVDVESSEGEGTSIVIRLPRVEQEGATS